MSHRTGGCWILPGLVTVQVSKWGLCDRCKPEQHFRKFIQDLLFCWRTETYFLDKILPHVKREMWKALQRPLDNQFEEEYYLWVILMLQETPERTVPLKTLFYESLQMCDYSLQCDFSRCISASFPSSIWPNTLLVRTTSLIMCQPLPDFPTWPLCWRLKYFIFYFL